MRPARVTCLVSRVGPIRNRVGLRRLDHHAGQTQRTAGRWMADLARFRSCLSWALSRLSRALSVSNVSNRPGLP